MKHSARRGTATVVVASLAALALTMTASPAAAVTLGQLAPAPTAHCNISPVDLLNPSAGGNSYVVPSAGTITSWSTSAAAGSGQMLEMKIFRKVADPMDYLVVGHDGPRLLIGGTVNNFPVNIPVQAGDVLGLNDANGASVPNACDFDASPATRFALDGDLADGQSATFGTDAPDVRNNVAAVFEATTPPVVTVPAVQPFNLAAAIKRCKKKFRKGSKARKRCIKKARARALADP